MTVYVDDAMIPHGRMRMSHLIADSPEELRAFADRLGLRRWIQAPGTWREHLDVSKGKRAEALDLGAVSVTPRWIARRRALRRDA